MSGIIGSWFTSLFGRNDNYIETSEKHRFVFKGLTWDKRNMARDGEGVYDTARGIMYICTLTYDSTGAPVRVFNSHSMELEGKINTLYNAGILNNALAFMNNANIYTVYKNGDKVVPDSLLRVDRNYRYWSLRGVHPENGTPLEFTGNLVTTGTGVEVVENFMADILHTDTPIDVQYSGNFIEGRLHSPSLVIHGNIYYMDLFDANRILLTSKPCVVKEVSSLAWAATAEANVTSIVIQGNQENEAGEIFLYQGQPLNTITLYIKAIYGDGTYRIIDNYAFSSRLPIEYPDIPADAPVGSVWDIIVKYYVDDSTTGTGHASIDAVKKVRVIDDVAVHPIRELITLPITRSSEASGVRTNTVTWKVLCHYLEGMVMDVSNSNKLTPVTLNTLYTDVQQTSPVSLSQGFGSTTTFTDRVNVQMSWDFGKWVTLNNTTTTFEPRLAALDWFTSHNAGEVLMRLGGVASSISNDLTSNINYGTAGYNGTNKSPSHFKVRSTLDTSYYHTPDFVSINNAGRFAIVDHPDTYSKLTGYETYNMGARYIILVEFYHLNTISGDYELLCAKPYIVERATIPV